MGLSRPAGRPGGGGAGDRLGVARNQGGTNQGKAACKARPFEVGSTPACATALARSGARTGRSAVPTTVAPSALVARVEAAGATAQPLVTLQLGHHSAQML